MVNSRFWNGRRVFLTGHTGFKGSWLCLWLHTLGAEVTGYALDPPTDPSLFDLSGVGKLITSITGDVRDGKKLTGALTAARPEIVIHMAAQPLVRDSYKIPAETYEINVMGTVNLLEAVRNCASVKAVINVTTDKCYENQEWIWGYRENDRLGGYDPYSNSKACSELVTAAYRSSYFNPGEYVRHGIALATVRAGNVIGGGDWATDRLLPDCARSVLKGERILIRSPQAIRPWQHVLEPLAGYLMLAQRLYEDGAPFSESWNFGPDESDARTVEWLVRTFCSRWGGRASYEVEQGEHPHEAHYLKLDCSKAKARLGWHPRWGLDEAIGRIIDWTRTYQDGNDVKAVCREQIEAYMSASRQLK